MIPPKRGASEGRANSKGIPVLYLATDRETAMSEIRPWIGSNISVGTFRTRKDLRVIDCSNDDKKFSIFLKEPSAEKRELAVWRSINRAFSTPISPNDREADYVPTQILAELFKKNKYDGLVFKSSCAEGHNVVLFDLKNAELVGARLFSAQSLRFGFHEAGGVSYTLK
jgi:RES domain-containing protein